MKLGRLLRMELAKVFGQRGTYAGYAVLGVLVGLVTWAMWRYGPPFEERLTEGSEFIVGGSILSGMSVARFLMEPSMVVLVPLMVAAVSGGLIAAEMQQGTMRTLLVRPVRRWAVLTAKQIAAWAHAISLTAFLGVFALAVGYAVFGGGELVHFRGGLTILPERLGLLRIAEGYAVCALAMCAVASLALLMSQLLKNPLTASALVIAFILVGMVLGQIEYFEWLEPYLLTSHLTAFGEIFHNEINISALRWPLWCLALYAVVPFVIGQIIFRYRDITC